MNWKRESRARHWERIRRERRKLEHTYAHEIAHAYIMDTYPHSGHDIEDIESDADRLASEWGFELQTEKTAKWQRDATEGLLQHLDKNRPRKVL